MTTAFDAHFWNLLQTLAWVYLADRELVEEAGRPATCAFRSRQVTMPDGSEIWAELPDYPPNVMMLLRDEEHLGSRYASLFDAREALVSELAAGRIAAIGLRNNQGDPTPVPPEFWLDARFTHEPETASPRELFRPGASCWFALRFPREQILAIWPAKDPAIAQAPSPTPRLSFLVLARRWSTEQPRSGLTAEDIAVDLVHAAEDGAFTSRPEADAPKPAAYNARFDFVVHTVDQRGEPQGPHWIRNYSAAGPAGGEHPRRLIVARDISVELPAVATWLASEPGAEWARIRGLMTPSFLLPPVVQPPDGDRPPDSLAGHELQCAEWLLGLMQQSEADRGKATLFEEANLRWQLTKRGFNRAWGLACLQAGDRAWNKPGRKSKRVNRIAN